MTARTDHRPHAAAARRRPAPSRKSGFGGTLFGIFIGVALGLSLAAAVAFYLMKAGNPYRRRQSGAGLARDVAKDTPKSGRGEAARRRSRVSISTRYCRVSRSRRVQPEEPPTRVRAVRQDRRRRSTSARRRPTRRAKAAERFWLQAGSFASEADAENLKARLALAGWEAAIQPVSLPDKGLRYRVRLGPYDNTDELNRG